MPAGSATDNIELLMNCRSGRNQDEWWMEVW